ncbi:MAG: CBS domain-containing protein [Gemmataceae bacterium]
MNRLPKPDRNRSGATLPALGLYPMELSRNIRADSVSRLEPSPPLAIDAAAAVAEAVEALRTGKVGCLLVTERGRVVGIFTERDLLTRVFASGRSLETTMRAVMTPNPVTVAPKDPVRTAIKRMQRGGYRHLPVVDEDGRPVGTLSARRVMHYIVEHFPALVFNLPPDGNQYPEKAEGA